MGPQKSWVFFFDGKENKAIDKMRPIYPHFSPKWSTKLSGDSQPTPPPPRYLRIP